jgi:hypothetical protein
MLADTVAVAGTGETPEGPALDPDDINNWLAEIAVELAAEAPFREPSAAERARRPVGPAKPGRNWPLRWPRDQRTGRGYATSSARSARGRTLLVIAIAVVVAAVLFSLLNRG